MTDNSIPFPGLVALIGSGETSSTGRQVFEILSQDLPDSFQANVLETPAGFELNSALVAGRVADFLQLQLQNRRAKVNIIPARARGTSASPDDPAIVEPLYASCLTFLGPGSPTYAVRQLAGSLAWDVLRASQRAGAALVFASAAAVACGKLAMPVYEIFKVGEDPIWKPGLGLFSPFGLNISVIPHWNNSEGGQDVDTSHCFIGQRRFEILQAQLSPKDTLLGLDEHTAIIFNLAAERCQVIGRGQIHILRDGAETTYSNGSVFGLTDLGEYRLPPDLWQDIPAEIARRFQLQTSPPAIEPVPEEVLKLIAARQAARNDRLWAEADRIRQAIHGLGWTVIDTATGPQVKKV